MGMTRQINRPRVPKRLAVTPCGDGQRQPRLKTPLFLEAVAGLPSVISGREPCQACHIRYADIRFNKRSTGKGEKPSDCWVVPMTPIEHAEQNGGNEQMFWYVRGIDPTAIANELYEAWSGTTDKFFAIMAMREIIDRITR